LLQLATLVHVDGLAMDHTALPSVSAMYNLSPSASVTRPDGPTVPPVMPLRWQISRH
jgi:hypothetical protein